MGDIAAYDSQSDPTWDLLYQDVRLPDTGKLEFRAWVAYDNANGDFVTPHSLSTGDGENPPNQQFRIDVMKPSAPLRSVDNSDVLQRVYRTEVGDDPSSDWFKVSADVSKLVGRSVRLRFAEVDNQLFLGVGIDGVRIKKS